MKVPAQGKSKAATRLRNFTDIFQVCRVGWFAKKQFAAAKVSAIIVRAFFIYQSPSLSLEEGWIILLDLIIGRFLELADALVEQGAASRE